MMVLSENEASSFLEEDRILRMNDLIVTFQSESSTTGDVRELRAVDGVSFSLRRGTTLGIVGESGCGKSVTALALISLIPKPSGRVASGTILFRGQGEKEPMDLIGLDTQALRKIRGKRISMIFQEPMTALNPVHKIGKQMAEVYDLHYPQMISTDLTSEMIGMLDRVGIANSGQVLEQYPHELSGGMRQRVMIAMALAPKPDILIADEPTTALDVTVQAQILELIGDLQKEMGMSVILITHDLGVIAENCDEAVVMYGGKVVEWASVPSLFGSPYHPYTQGLLGAIPALATAPKTILPTIDGRVPSLNEMPSGCRFSNRCLHVMDICHHLSPEDRGVGSSHVTACHLYNGHVRQTDTTKYQKAQISDNERFNINKRNHGVSIETFARAERGRERRQHQKHQKHYKDQQDHTQPILKISNLIKHFPVHGGIFLRQKGVVHAVDDVSFHVAKGETLGVVGESGCGKSTLGRCIMGLYPLTAGSVRLDGHEVSRMRGRERKAMRLKMQMIFQDPFESLNGRHTVGEILKEKYLIHNRYDEKSDQEISHILNRVGLSERVINRFPHEFSGGQRQRIGIARAISLNPEVVICDEPVSALDVSVQSQILNLILELQQEMGLTCLFISHDLSVVRHLSDRIVVMYLGEIVEMADAETIYKQPLHPYTQALISAIPIPDPHGAKDRILLTGEVPSPQNPPSGCRFHTRCHHVMDVCKVKPPLFQPHSALMKEGGNHTGHWVSCHLYQS